jgi:hypothetical protein
VAIGFVECDQLATFDRATLRRKYAIPEDRRVVLLATAPPFVTLRASVLMRKAFRQAWVRGPLAGRGLGAFFGLRWPGMDYFASYMDILSCVRRFADRHGALLVGKTRDKHEDPGYVRRMLDGVVSDISYNPFTTLELLSLADLYVGMASSMAFEAVFAGCRMRTIIPFPPAVYEHPVFFELKRDFFYGAPGIWNAPGLSEIVRTYVAAEWEAFRAWAEHGPWEIAVDPEVRSAVAKRTMGFDDLKASARFLDLVESVVGGGGEGRA